LNSPWRPVTPQSRPVAGHLGLTSTARSGTSDASRPSWMAGQGRPTERPPKPGGRSTRNTPTAPNRPVTNTGHPDPLTTASRLFTAGSRSRVATVCDCPVRPLHLNFGASMQGQATGGHPSSGKTVRRPHASRDRPITGSSQPRRASKHPVTTSTSSSRPARSGLSCRATWSTVRWWSRTAAA
jgi:hypothetical protein